MPVDTAMIYYEAKAKHSSGGSSSTQWNPGFCDTAGSKCSDGQLVHGCKVQRLKSVRLKVSRVVCECESYTVMHLQVIDFHLVVVLSDWPVCA